MAASPPATKGQPAHGGKVVSWLSKVFEFNPAGLNWPRAVMILDIMLVPLVVFWTIGYEQYLVSAVFGVLFAGLADPGGGYGHRAWHVAVFGLIGAGLTALGFGIGGDAWGWLVLAAFAVTLVSGLAVMFGVHSFVAAYLLDVWFIVVLGLAFGLHHQARITSYTWAQVLAWAGGSALWIAVTFIAWLVRGRQDRPEPFAEIPGDTSRRKLTRPLVMYALIRAIVIAGTFALAFGLDLSHGYWMPIAAIVAMKPSLEQSTLAGVQRLAGALIGAAAAALLLLIPANEHGSQLVAITHGLERGRARPLHARGGDPVLELRDLLRGRRRGSADPDGPAAALQLRCRGLPGALDAVRRSDRCARHVPRRPARQACTRRETASTSWPGRMMTEAEFRALYERLRAQVPWGPDDRRGALNYITQAEVLAACGAVRLGRAVSLAVPVEERPAPDNPDPARHQMKEPLGADAGPGLSFSMDRIAMNVHGNADSHVDALCHVIFDGMLYNGVPADTVTAAGAAELSIGVAADGIVGRGVLLDVPRSRGVPWLEPGDHVTADDLFAAERDQGVRVGRGDIVLVRVGHRLRRTELGPWDAAAARAGLHPALLAVAAERQIAVLGSDGNNDTAPSVAEGVDFPVHVLAVNALGIHLMDYLEFAELAPLCEREGRWSFLCMIAPLRLPTFTGSPVNPIAIL